MVSRVSVLVSVLSWGMKLMIWAKELVPLASSSSRVTSPCPPAGSGRSRATWALASVVACTLLLQGDHHTCDHL